MIIKEIELNNFRIYKGVNKIDLTPDGERNIVVVSGNNGFGKTTFLMSLVWCLYGKQMNKVDDLYKKEIDDKGGYPRYIGTSLNKQAKQEGETRFSVAITFTDVEIPNTTCTEIKIIRSYDLATSTDDELKILIDGRESDLFSGEDKTEEEELFVRDYILPIEIAKFFFFDAEKIVSFAQINTLEQREELSKAYSQVLGIHKYEELKKSLENIQDDYRRDAAQPSDRRDFNQLLAQIKSDEETIQEYAEERLYFEDQLSTKKYEANETQEKLIREGDTMTVDRLNELRQKRNDLSNEMKQAQDGLKEIFTYIPFGLAGNIMSELAEQLKTEREFNQNKIQLEGVEQKTEAVLNELDQAKQRLQSEQKIIISREVRNFYEEQIKHLILKHFYNEFDTNRFEHFHQIHEFSEIQYNEFQDLLRNIKDCKSQFETLYNRYSKAKAELYSIERKIKDAERNAESEYVKNLRDRKESLDRQVQQIMTEIAKLEVQQNQLRDAIIANKKRKEQLAKKIEVSDQHKAVDVEASRLNRIIQHFLIRFKDEKKKALEQKLETKLKSFLHKKNLVNKVVVDIQGNGADVDINLIDFDDKIIDKGNLSMGERQMFASALLGALVEETELAFPVFIDSPMQKFDTSHSQNILTQFYPKVSKQVILFPLLMKELTEEEYDLIKPIVSKAYLIQHNNNASYFNEVNPDNLFEQYKNQ